MIDVIWRAKLITVLYRWAFKLLYKTLMKYFTAMINNKGPITKIRNKQKCINNNHI